MKQPNQKIVAEDGVEVFYWINSGSGMNKKMVVLCPGSSMNHSSLERLEAGLNERGHPTLTFDPRGFGYSDAPTKPEFYELERHSQDLEMILARKGIERPEFVATSFGFMPAVDYISRTKNASKLTGICTAPNFKDTAPNVALYHFFDKVGRYVLEWPGFAITGLGHLLRGTKRSYPDQSQLEGASELAVLKTIVDQPWHRIRANNVMGRVAIGFDVSEQLGGFYVPTHMIYGSKDAMVVPTKAEPIVRGLVVGELDIDVVPGAPHSLPTTNPQVVLQVMDAYSA